MSAAQSERKLGLTDIVVPAFVIAAETYALLGILSSSDHSEWQKEIALVGLASATVLISVLSLSKLRRIVSPNPTG